MARIGGGELELTGGSPRFYINGEYQNVEFESEIMVLGKDTSQVYLSARSNHERRPEGFGGYPLYIDVRGDMFFKKELTHVIGYSERLASVKVPYKQGEWFKARVKITNIEGGNVKMEAWFNNKEYTSLVDSGQIKCGTQLNTPPFTGVGESCFFRVNSITDGTSVNVKYRNAVIRKVTT